MAKKKKLKPVGSPADTEVGRQNVILEDMQSKMNMCIEGIGASRESIERKMDGLLLPMNRSIEAVGGGVRVNSGKLDELSAQIDLVEMRLTKRIDRFQKNVSARFNGVEANFDAKFDTIIQKLDSIDKKLDTKADKSQVDAIEERVAKLEAG
jgi:polyhydroxyalkanoate synthesis regulator phasin